MHATGGAKRMSVVDLTTSIGNRYSPCVSSTRSKRFTTVIRSNRCTLAPGSRLSSAASSIQKTKTGKTREDAVPSGHNMVEVDGLDKRLDL